MSLKVMPKNVNAALNAKAKTINRPIWRRDASRPTSGLEDYVTGLE